MLRVSAKTDRASTLAGDNSIRALSAALKKAVTNSVSSVSGNKYNALNTIGITIKNGVMSVDKTKLTEALDDKIQQVSDLFTVADGFATALNPIAEQYGAVDGLLADRIEGLNKSTRSIANRILKLEARVSKFETQLVRQFSSLEQAVAKLQQQGNFLAGSL